MKNFLLFLILFCVLCAGAGNLVFYRVSTPSEVKYVAESVADEIFNHVPSENARTSGSGVGNISKTMYARMRDIYGNICDNEVGKDFSTGISFSTSDIRDSKKGDPVVTKVKIGGGSIVVNRKTIAVPEKEFDPSVSKFWIKCATSDPTSAQIEGGDDFPQSDNEYTYMPLYKREGDVFYELWSMPFFATYE